MRKPSKPTQTAATPRRVKTSNKTKFVCLKCGQRSWGRVGLVLVCRLCRMPMTIEPARAA